MSKKIIIPYGKCLSITPNINGIKKINKVIYNDKAFKTDVDLAFTFEFNPFIFTYENGNVATITNDPNFPNSKYIVKIEEEDWSSSTQNPRIYNEIYVKVDVTDFVMQYSDLAYAYFEDSVTMYERVINSGSTFTVSNQERKYVNHTQYPVTAGAIDEFRTQIVSGRYYVTFNCFRDYKDLTDNTETYYLHAFRFYTKKPSYIDDEKNVSVSSEGTTHSINDNEFMDNETTYSGIVINLYNSNKILNYYKNVRQTIDAKIILADYYDEDNNLVINKTNGDIIDIGDIVRFVDNKNGLYANKSFQVTSSEFVYSGVPAINIKAKEFLDTRSFTVNLTNPDYMTVEYSYIDVSGNSRTGNISQTTTFTDIGLNQTITITATPLTNTDEYSYTVDNQGGTYNQNVSVISITATRTINTYTVIVGAKYQNNVLDSQTLLNIPYGTRVYSSDYYNADTFTTVEAYYSGKTTNSVRVTGNTSVYTVYSTMTPRTYAYTITASYGGNEIADYSNSAAYGTTINILNIFGQTYETSSYVYSGRTGDETITITSEGQEAYVEYSIRKPKGYFTISNTTVNRDVNTNLVNNSLFNDYYGSIQFTGIVRYTLSNGTIGYIVGSSGGNGTITLNYNSYYHGWVIMAFDVEYDEDDYSAGVAILKIDSNGASVSWVGTSSAYNVYTVNSLYVGATEIKAV